MALCAEGVKEAATPTILSSPTPVRRGCCGFQVFMRQAAGRGRQGPGKTMIFGALSPTHLLAGDLRQVT